MQIFCVYDTECQGPLTAKVGKDEADRLDV